MLGLFSHNAEVAGEKPLAHTDKIKSTAALGV